MNKITKREDPYFVIKQIFKNCKEYSEFSTVLLKNPKKIKKIPKTLKIPKK